MRSWLKVEKPKKDHTLTSIVHRLTERSASCRIISLLILRLHNVPELPWTYPNRLFIEFSTQTCNCVLSKFAFYRNFSEKDFADRLTFWEEMLQRFADDETFPNRIMFLDKAHFHLRGQVTKHNDHIYAHENPKAFITKPLQSERVTVWMAVRWTDQTVFVRWKCDWSVLSEDVANVPVAHSWNHSWISTTTGLVCARWSTLTGLASFVSGSTSILDSNELVVVLQRSTDQPDIPTWLPVTFGSGVIRNPLSFRTQYANLDELKQKIRESVREITRKTRVKALQEFTACLQNCVDNDGKHIEW